jgi:hypothetical protein
VVRTFGLRFNLPLLLLCVTVAVDSVLFLSPLLFFVCVWYVFRVLFRSCISSERESTSTIEHARYYVVSSDSTCVCFEWYCDWLGWLLPQEQSVAVLPHIVVVFLYLGHPHPNVSLINARELESGIAWCMSNALLVAL